MRARLYGNQTWQVDQTSYEYHSANYLVAQAYREDAPGTSVRGNLQTRVFDKVGMPDTVSRISLSTAYQQAIAWKHSTA